MNNLLKVLPRKELPLGEAEAGGLARQLHALADPTRLQIVGVLHESEGLVCVFELVERFNLAQPTISHHLKILADANIVYSRKSGLYHYYYVRRSILSQILAEVQALAPNLLS